MRDFTQEDKHKAEAVARGWEILDRIRKNWELTKNEGIRHPLIRSSVVPWHPLSLEAGDLGLCLIYSSADRFDPDGQWDSLAHKHASVAFDYFCNTSDLNIGLFSGASGLAFALTSLSREGRRYKNALKFINETLILKTRALISNLNPNQGIPTDSYDMVNGLSGVAWYILHRSTLYGGAIKSSEDSRLEKLLEDILEEFKRRASLLPYLKMGFFTDSTQITNVEQAYYGHLKSGYINVGFAHGLAGVLAVLGEAKKQGWRGLSDSILRIRSTLNRSIVYTKYGPDTDYYIYPQSNGRYQEFTRSAWCYGNPGLAIAVNLSVPSHPDTLPSAKSLIASCIKRPSSIQQIDNPSLCHGYSGLLLSSANLGVSDDKSLDKILLNWNASRTYGLDVEHSQDYCVDSPGVLEGSGGAAVALLHIGEYGDIDSPVRLQLFGRRSAC
ncbi:lanthionine synthetase LanC family protein [Austwickia chelonae]|uniref:lanthionine synthetase LanC family protein n=1 Tax=Austwickia chelonae TaxID=100225 RepID=UPI000E260760|nr:lanthionine synthetase LanC family protein [Austwickia chelonae]